jgi:hypothetical protein
MTTLRRATLILLGTLTFAGCDTTSEGEREQQNEYVESVNQINRGIVTAGEQEVAGLRAAQTPGEARGALAEFKSQLDDGAAELRGLDRPDEVEDEHDELIDNTREGAAQVRVLLGFANARDRAAFAAALPTWTQEVHSLNREREAILEQINDELGGG